MSLSRKSQNTPGSGPYLACGLRMDSVVIMANTQPPPPTPPRPSCVIRPPSAQGAMCEGLCIPRSQVPFCSSSPSGQQTPEGAHRRSRGDRSCRAFKVGQHPLKRAADKPWCPWT
jgi:hypothetical protein